MNPLHVTGARSGWQRWWRRCLRWWQRHRPGAPRTIPDGLWQHTLLQMPYVADWDEPARTRLRELSGQFLARKEFTGAHGLSVTDAMAVSIAAQACVPLAHWDGDALRWYDDFVGIVVQPDAVWAPRRATDEAGVEHRWREPLVGEAMAGGPVMLAWSHVAHASSEAHRGHNVVIHEFAHKLDMRGKGRHQPPDGCPRLPPGFMGHATRQAAQAHWHRVMQGTYQRFQHAVALHERFGAPAPWLDAYGAQSPAEFFAVACEAYFVNRQHLGHEWPELLPLFDAFFRPPRRP